MTSIDRTPLISFLLNASDTDLHLLFGVIHEIKNAIDFESTDESQVFEIFSTLLWKITEGATMVYEGNSRKDNNNL